MARFIFRQILHDFFLGLPLLVLAWAIWRWAHSFPKIGEPPWRYYVAYAAVGLAGVSSLLWLILAIWAIVIGGFPFYDPTVLSFYRWGLLTGAAGLLTSFAGKGKLRWPTCGLSFLMIFLWFAAATSE
ncbi:MAG TPA: hypothetical protein VGI46_09540 [Candidatus Acidoferrum sp.]|jgi:hypothetical protein